MTEPRVIHIDDGREFRGGQHQVLLLMEGLQRAGIAQWLAARPESPLAERAAKLGIKVVPFDFKGELDLFAPGRLAELAEEVGANFLHAHTAHAHTLGLRAVRRAKKIGLRLVTTRRVDFSIKKGFFRGRKYTSPGQHFIAISEGVRDVLIDGGVDPARIDLVASGVPPLPADALSRGSARQVLGIGPDEFAIGTVGALTDHKGHRWLVEAAAIVVKRHSRSKFYIVGEGELRGELEAQIAALGLQEKVRLLGYVPEARAKLAGFDLYVSSSHLEGLGTAILDAMLAGLPVVAAAAGGVPDAVKPGLTGILVPVRNSAMLAERIISAIETPEEQLRYMTNAARQNVELNFSAEGMARGTLTVYRRLLGN